MNPIYKQLKYWHHQYLLHQQRKDRKEFALANKGNRYQCNLCNLTSNAFMPDGFQFPILELLDVVGGGYREESVCPNCGSKDRERLIKAYFEKYPNWLNQQDLLHFAPEQNLKPFLRNTALASYKNADLISFHADEEMDATNISLANASVTRIICNHVLEHIPDDIAAMKEFYRVLKSDGIALLQVPLARNLKSTIESTAITYAEERETYFGQKDHVRIYADDYFERLKSVGFHIQRVKPSEFLSQEEISKLSLNNDEELFFANK